MKTDNEEIIYMKKDENGVYVIDNVNPQKILKQDLIDKFGKNDFAKGIIDDMFNFGSEDDEEVRELLSKYNGKGMK